MRYFNPEEFYKFILKNDVLKFFEEPVKLKSGRESYWYVNWRNITNDVYLLDRLTDYVLDFVKEKELKVDCFYGVPEGATKIAIITQYKWSKMSLDYGLDRYTLPMGRGKPKDHGVPEDKYFIGRPKGKTIIIEDTVTTGNSLLRNIDILKGLGVEVLATLCLTDRMELRDDGKSVREIVESEGIAYYALSNAVELLPLAYRKKNPSKKILKAIIEEFEKYGITKIYLNNNF